MVILFEKNALKYGQIIQGIQLLYPTRVRYFAHTNPVSPATDLTKYPFFSRSIFLVISISIHLPTTFCFSIHSSGTSKLSVGKVGSPKRQILPIFTLLLGIYFPLTIATAPKRVSVGIDTYHEHCSSRKPLRACATPGLVSRQTSRSDRHSITNMVRYSLISTSSVCDQRDIMTKIKKTSCVFPVLKLPPEIRNLIWRCTVVAAEAIQLEQFGSQHTRGQLVPSLLRSGKQIHAEDDKRLVPSRLAVAFACRQLYLEVTPIYYSDNWFAVSLTSTVAALGKVQDFVVAIGPENARCIRNLCLVLPGIMPLLHLQLTLTLGAGVRGHSPLAALYSFLVETQAIFHGAPAIVLSCRTVVMIVLTSDGKAIHLSGQSMF